MATGLLLRAVGGYAVARRARDQLLGAARVVFAPRGTPARRSGHRPPSGPVDGWCRRPVRFEARASPRDLLRRTGAHGAARRRWDRPRGRPPRRLARMPSVRRSVAGSPRACRERLRRARDFYLHLVPSRGVAHGRALLHGRVPVRPSLRRLSGSHPHRVRLLHLFYTAAWYSVV